MEATMTLKPRVYVGTYGKYNRGSIAGGWVTLTDYNSYAAFLTACRRLHKDESDPELMIQDVDEMPDGLSFRDFSEQDFNDIIEAVAAEAVPEDAPRFQIIDYSEKAIAVVGDTRDIKDKLKELGGRFNPRLTCGAGWIFPKTKRDALEKLLEGGKVEKSAAKPKSKPKKNLAIEEAKAEYLKVWPGDEKMIKYCQGKISNAVKLSDGRIVIVEKQNIKTSFCFGYSTCGQGSEYDEASNSASYARTSESYFREQNLEAFDQKIELLKGNKEDCWGKTPYLSQSNYVSVGLINIHEVVGLYYSDFVEQLWGTYSEISDADRKLIIAMYEEEREKMNKRLDTYLKRYGLSKLHVWTYWLDE